MSEGGNDVKSRLDFITLQKLQQLKDSLPEGEDKLKKEKPPKVLPPILLSNIESFLNHKPNTQEIVPRVGYLEETKGLTERLSAVATEHFGDTLPIIHFTNAAVGDDLNNLVSSGFIERFMKGGSKGNLHVGAFRTQDSKGSAFRDMTLNQDTLLNVLDKARDIATEFHHHGFRTNKNQLGEQRGSGYSLPAVILFPKPNSLSRGSDNYDHWIVKDDMGNEQILSVVTLEPVHSIAAVMNDRSNQNKFLKEIIHSLGMTRLRLLQDKFKKEGDINHKQELAIYAHDLVDGYLVTRDDYDNAFHTSDLNPQTVDKLKQRREKYNLFKQNSEVDSTQRTDA